MTTIDNSGPAFPQFDVVAGERDGHGDAIEAYTVATGGMTLRDYFAGQALVGILSGYWANSNMGGLSQRDVSDEAYVYADAMIASRLPKRPEGM